MSSRKELTKKAYWLLHEGQLAFAELERNGMKIDVPYLDKAIRNTHKKIAKLEKRLLSDKIYVKHWKKKFGDKAKLGNRKQLSDVLFNQLGFKQKETVSIDEEGKTSKDALSHIELPFLKDYQFMNRLQKMLTTNLYGIKRELDSDGILRPSLSLNITRSLRSSCSDPNGQNFPKRDDFIAKIVRQAFIPRNNRHLIETDFKGVEVSTAADVSKDRTLIRYVTDKSTDMHRDTAMDLFNLTKEEVSKPHDRDWAKNRFVFPQFYGSVYFNCAPSLWEAVVKAHENNVYIPGCNHTVLDRLAIHGIKKLGRCDPQHEPVKGTFEYRCKEAEQTMWQKRFKEMTAWKKKVFNDYLEKGEFYIATGFKFDDPLSKNQVINTYIQGPAFHLNLTAIIFILKYLRKYKMRTLMTMQIHDSQISDSPQKELDDFLDLTKEVIEKDVPKFWPWVVVPLEVEASISELNGNWYSTEEVKW